MLLELKKIGKHTLIYGSGLLISKAIGFFLIPLYTHYLTPSDYGILELLDLTGYFIGYFIAAGMNEAVLRHYHAHESQHDRNTIFSTAILFNLLIGVCVVALLIPFSTALSQFLLRAEGYSLLFDMMLVSVLIGVILDLEKTVLRAQQNPIIYTATSLGFTLLAVSLNIYFVAGLHKGIAGIYYSSLITSVLIVIFLTFRLLRGAGVTFHAERLKEMLKYSLPFVPAGIFSFILMWSDRYILQYYHGTDSVGMYALGYKMGMMVVFLVVTPFTLFWNSYIFEIQKRPDAGVFYSRIATYFILILLFVGLGISTFSYELITIMAPPSYLPAHTVIPLIVLAMIFMTSDTVFQVGLLIKGKSSKLPIAKGIAAIVNIFLNFLFVPSYGMIGSAWATAIAFCLYLVIILRVSQREYRIEFEYIRMMKIIFVTLVIFTLSKLVPVESVLVSIGIKLSMLSLFPVLLVLLGFLNQGELEFLRRSADALLRRSV